MADKSVSVKFREEGNKILKSIDEDFATVLMESKLKEALIFYNKAYDSSLTDTEKSSACKNVTVVMRKLLRLYCECKSKESRLIDYYMDQCQKYSKEAFSCGKEYQTFQWLDNINCNLADAYEVYYENLKNNSSFEQRITRFLKLLHSSPEYAKCCINYLLCRCYFNQAIELQQENNIKLALTKINECDYYYEECQRYFSSYDIYIIYAFDFDIKNLNYLYEDVNAHRHMLLGIKSKLIGQNLLESCVKDHEELELDMVYEVVDWLRDSIIKTRNKDIENEAEVCSDLGYIFEKIIKDKTKSKEYFKQSWHLADSLKPKIFTTKKWFIRCSEAIRSYQQEIIDEEEREANLEREKVKPEIQADLDKLEKSAKDGYYKYLPFIYKEYPPKNSNYVLPSELQAKNIKKAVKDALTHYHPDKNPKSEYGNAWYYIAEHITKLLTRFYESLKCTE